MAKFFRVALEGDTTDGRKITRQDILDCAETFDPKLYGIRVNLEHYRGLIPGGPFDMLGDVTGVNAQEDEIDVGGVKQRVMGLYAQITPLPALVEINKKKQKIYSSIEIGQNCRGTGKAYLKGCAVTDSPASFGCDVLEFAAKHPEYFANRKSGEDSLIVVSHEIPGDAFDDSGQAQTNADPTGVFASMKKFFDGLTGAQPAQAEPAAAAAAPAQGGSGSESVPAAAPDANFTQVAALMGQMTATLQSMNATIADSQAKAETRFAAIEAKLENTPAPGFTARPLATGADASAVKAEF